MNTYPIRKAHDSQKETLEMLAHDLRTPMSSVMGAAQMAMLAQAQGKPIDNQLQQIVGAVAAMDRMLVQICGGESCGVTARELESELRTMIAPRAAVKHQRLSIDLSELGSGELPLDSLKLCRVLSNLLVNAVKFTPVGGDVTLRAAVCINAGRMAGVTFLVRDSGMGMKRSFQRGMYRMHARAPESAHLPGQGLGLSIVQRLVGEMGGTVMAESEWGRGTMFSVYIPLHTEAYQ